MVGYTEVGLAVIFAVVGGTFTSADNLFRKIRKP